MNPFYRRQLLVGTGASILLKPFIDCIEAKAAGPDIKPCFLTMWKGQSQYGGGNGSDGTNSVSNWVPTMNGNNVALSPLLSPFESVKEYMTFLIGLDVATKAKPEWHHTIPTLFTGASGYVSGALPANESIDWFVAKKMGPKVEPLVINPHFAVSEQKGQDFASFGRADDGKIFRKVPYSNPLTMFNDVFSGVKLPMPGPPGPGAADEAKRRAAAVERSRRSMLDALRGDAARIKAKSAPEHKRQIDSMLDGVRELETTFIGQGGKLSPELAAHCALPEKPAVGSGKSLYDSEENIRRNWQGLTNVALSAMRCGLRSVVSFHFMDHHCQQFVPGKIRDDWKSLSDGVTPYHFENVHRPVGAPWIKIEQFIYSFFASLLSGMKATPAGETNLLEKSLGVFMTTMSHNHSNNVHSFFTAGNAGGRLNSNRILKFGDPMKNAPSGKPHNDLLVSVLQAFGHADVKTYGDPALCSGGLAGFLKT